MFKLSESGIQARGPRSTTLFPAHQKNPKIRKNLSLSLSKFPVWVRMSIRRPRAPRISFVRKYMRIARACASSMLLHALCVREGERERVAQCASSSCCCCRSRPRARPRLCAHQYTHTHSRAGYRFSTRARAAFFITRAYVPLFFLSLFLSLGFFAAVWPLYYHISFSSLRGEL